MTTLNSLEEIKLAEKLIELHPWADMVRFARSGGEANAIAIRIARAASGSPAAGSPRIHEQRQHKLMSKIFDHARVKA